MVGAFCWLLSLTVPFSLPEALDEIGCGYHISLIPPVRQCAAPWWQPIIALAVRHKLAAVYWERFFVTAGGLISYGADYIDQYRHAAGYVDRILKGEKSADSRCRR